MNAVYELVQYAPHRFDPLAGETTCRTGNYADVHIDFKQLYSSGMLNIYTTVYESLKHQSRNQLSAYWQQFLERMAFLSPLLIQEQMAIWARLNYSGYCRHIIPYDEARMPNDHRKLVRRYDFTCFFPVWPASDPSLLPRWIT